MVGTMRKGAPVPGQALVATPSSPQAVSTEGFDPSRLSALSFVLPYEDGSERLRVSHDDRSGYWADKVLIRQYESDDNTLYVDLADLNWLIGALKLVAIATEARRDRPNPITDTPQ